MKKIFYTTLALLVTMVAGAQTGKHELSVNASGGLHALSHTLSNNGANSGKFGGGAGIGYNYNLNKSWSIGTGVDFTHYSSGITFERLAGEHTGFDNMENTDFTFTYDATGFSENVSAWLLEIPITARYSLPLGEKGNSLRFTGGVKFGLPVNGSYTVSADNLQTAGSYTYENQEYREIPGVFVNERIRDYSSDFEASVSVQLTLEAAYRLAIGEKYGLSFGVYCNYGLNDIQSKNDAHPIAFDVNGNKPYAHNSVLHSGFASSIRPVAFGLKVRFDLGL